MPRFLTRHSVDFDLTDGSKPIDASRSPYMETFDDYPQKVAALALVIGTSQFLWAVEKAKGFRYIESDKPMEWEVELPQERIIGFVDTKKWDAYLNSSHGPLPSCFSIIRPKGDGFSVLLPFPLYVNEIVDNHRIQ